MVSSPPSGLDFKSPRKGRSVPSRETAVKLWTSEVPAIEGPIDALSVLAPLKLRLAVGRR